MMRVNIKFVRNGSVITTVVDAESVGAAIVASLKRGESPLSASALKANPELSNV